MESSFSNIEETVSINSDNTFCNSFFSSFFIMSAILFLEELGDLLRDLNFTFIIFYLKHYHKFLSYFTQKIRIYRLLQQDCRSLITQCLIM